MWHLALLFLSSHLVSAGEKCYGLALEGGGSRGAFEAGAIWALVNNLPADEVRWNIITGISTGALNTGGFSNYPYGEEKAAAQFLIDTWSTIDQEDIYKDWSVWGISAIEGIFFRSGFYNNSPLKHLVKNLITSPQRNMTVGATNLDTGAFTRFNETFPNIESAVVASSSAPWFFPTLHMNGTTYSDGGILINIDVFTAIERCQQIADNADIVIDMIYLQPPVLEAPDPGKKWTVSDVEERVDELKKYYHLGWYLFAARAAHPDINYRYVIQPEKSLPGGIVPLDFDRAGLNAMIELGKKDALEAITQQSLSKASAFPQSESLLTRRYFSE